MKYVIIVIKNLQTNVTCIDIKLVITGVAKQKKIIEFKCDKCNKNFTRKDSLNKHINLGRCKTLKKIKNNVNINTKGNLNTTNSIVNSKKSNIYNINLAVFAKDGFIITQMCDNKNLNN